MGLHRNKTKASPSHHSRILKGERKFIKFQATLTKRRRDPDVFQLDEDTSDLDFFPSHSENGVEKPVQRNAANARERARMQVLSKAFCRLKTCLPWVPPDTKLSKLDTLRLAATYIAYLMKILREAGGDESVQVASSNTRDCATHPVALTWPFTINSRSSYADYTSVPPVQENCRVVAEYCHEVTTDYRNLVPCEYAAMNQSNCHRREAAGHYNPQ